MDVRSIVNVEPEVEHNGTVPVWYLVKPREMHDLTDGGSLDTYLSVINNRMNDVMKTLTIITTLFMPISFLTGFFGMNFFEPVAGLTGWTSRATFGVVLAIFVCTPVGMFIWMKRRTWV